MLFKKYYMLEEDNDFFSWEDKIIDFTNDDQKIIELEINIPTNIDSSELKENEIDSDFINKELKSVFNNCKNDFSQESVIILKKKRGRTPKVVDSSKIHDKFSKDNMVYKLKTQSLSSIVNFINLFLQKKKIKRKLFKIDGKLLKQTKKEFNIDFFQMKIKDILTMKRTTKIKINKPSNKSIIKRIENNKKIKTILNMSLIDYINNIYMKLSAAEFKKQFGIYNILFKENQQFNEIRTQIEPLVQNGIINYYKNKQSRKKTVIKLKISK